MYESCIRAAELSKTWHGYGGDTVSLFHFLTDIVALDDVREADVHIGVIFGKFY